MRRIFVAAGLAAVLAGGAAWAQVDSPGVPVPVPSGTVPPAAAASGTPGSASTFIRGDAVQPSKIRAGTVTTASDGTWTMTFSPAFTGTTPTVLETPIGTTSMPIVCNLTAAPTSSTATGKCWQSSTLSVLGLNVTLNPFANAAASTQVQIIARDGS